MRKSMTDRNRERAEQVARGWLTHKLCEGASQYHNDQECLTDRILAAMNEARVVCAETSDGYHTFNELYGHRHALFSVICKAFNGWKSRFHDDGTMFDGWFIAGVDTPKGQATYHLPLTWWERFHCKELERAPKWDGHTPSDVIERIAELERRP